MGKKWWHWGDCQCLDCLDDDSARLQRHESLPWERREIECLYTDFLRIVCPQWAPGEARQIESDIIKNLRANGIDC